MKKKSIKQLLSAVLVIAMMATLLAVPAAAASGDVGTVWTPSSADGLTINGFTARANDFQGKGTIDVPVNGPCDVEVEYYYAMDGTVGVGDDTVALFTASGSTNLLETQTYTYTGTGTGTVRISTASTVTSYVTKITLKNSTSGASTKNTLALSKETLTVTAEAEGSIDAQVNGKVTGVYAISSDTSTATVAVDGKKVKVTGVAAGSATVTVALSNTPLTSAADFEAVDDALKKTVTVTVTPKPTGTVYVEAKSYSFTGEYKEDPTAGGTFTWGAKLDQMNSGHGVTNEGTTNTTGEASVSMNIPEDKTANITIGGCMYGKTTVDLISTEPDGLETSAVTVGVHGSTDPVYLIKNATGTVKIIFDLSSVNEYIHYIKIEWVEAASDPTGTPGTVDVWDFGAELVTSDSVTFVNKLGSTQAEIVTEMNKWFSNPAEPGAANNSNTLGDFTTSDKALTFDGAGRSDWRLRVQNAPTGLTYRDKGSERKGKVDPYFTDTVTYNGTIASNGSGAAGAYTLKNIAAGDKITYIQGEDGGNTYGASFVSGEAEAVALSGTGRVNANTVYATQTGSQKLTYNAGKGAMVRIYDEHPTTATISGTLTTAEGFTGDVVFTNADSGIAYTAAVSNGSYTVEVPNYLSGTSYKLSLTGDTSYLISSDRAVALSAGDTTKTADVAVNKITAVDVSGTVGPITAAEAAKLTITLTPTDPDKAYVPAVTVTAQTTGDSATWSAQLESGTEYTVAISNAPDYVLFAPATIQKSAADAAVEITLAATPTLAVSGQFVVLDADDQFAPLYPDSTYDALPVTVTALTFENVDDGYTYTATVADGGYTANLRAGAYLATATVDGYSTTTHVVVEGKAVSKDLLFVSTATAEAVDYAAEITVDPNGTGATNFKTITGALAYVKRMTRSDNERVTIKIAPGTYREQIAIDVPNVTLEPAAEGAEVIVTWYYGIGYKYYSATGTSTTDSWYSAERAFDKYTKPDIDVARWGCTVRIISTGFQAEGITFENSFNRYVTDEELVDGAEPISARATGLPARTKELDVNAKTATERAAAIWTDATNKRGDMAEFKNCKFLSSQDTLGTGARAYFKDCFIEGMTDYICGPGTVVFDGCTLNWKGYTEENAACGYITAPQTKNNYADDLGYLFVNCTVTADTDLNVTPGGWARMWGGANTAITLLNTELKSTTAEGADLINSDPWNDMDNGTAPSAATGLKEYGTHLTDGTAVAPKGPENTHMTAEEAEAVNVETYFNAWTPAWTPEYYSAEEEDPVEPETDALTLSKNTVSVTVGAKQSVTATVTGYEGKAVYAVSADTGIAAVAVSDKTVTVTGVAAGKTNIYVVMSDTASITADQAKDDASVQVLAVTVTAQTTGTATSGRSDTVTTTTATKTNDDGSKVTTVTSSDGAVTVTVTDADGEVVAQVSLPATTPSVGYKFVDVPEGHWAEEAINEMAGLGMVKGVDDVNHIYDMTSATSRGAVATILYRVSNGKPGIGASFADVAADAWYADGVAWAAKYGVVTGYDETTFAPDQAVTREQLAVMLYRYAKLLGMTTATTTDLTRFTDNGSISSWASEAMTWAVASGIIKGKDAGVLDAAAAATRAETAVMFDRFVDLMK